MREDRPASGREDRPASVVVRRVQPAEHALVAELTATVYLTEGYGDEDYEPALRDVAARDASAVVLVALLADRVVGAVTVAAGGGPWAEQAGPGEAVIRMLVVAPSARGSGAGEALVRACLDSARADGCERVLLSTQPSMTAAHRLYERVGFTRTPERDWEPVPGLQLLGYALDLAAPPPTPPPTQAAGRTGRTGRTGLRRPGPGAAAPR